MKELPVQIRFYVSKGVQSHEKIHCIIDDILYGG